MHSLMLARLLQAWVTERAKPGRRKCPRLQPFHFLLFLSLFSLSVPGKLFLPDHRASEFSSPTSCQIPCGKGASCAAGWLSSFPFFLFLLFSFFYFSLKIYHKTDHGQKVSCTPSAVQGAILNTGDMSQLPHLCPPPNILKPMGTSGGFHIIPPLQTLVALPVL